MITSTMTATPPVMTLGGRPFMPLKLNACVLPGEVQGLLMSGTPEFRRGYYHACCSPVSIHMQATETQAAGYASGWQCGAHRHPPKNRAIMRYGRSQSCRNQA